LEERRLEGNVHVLANERVVEGKVDHNVGHIGTDREVALLPEGSVRVELGGTVIEHDRGNVGHREWDLTLGTVDVTANVNYTIRDVTVRDARLIHHIHIRVCLGAVGGIVDDLLKDGKDHHIVGSVGKAKVDALQHKGSVGAGEHIFVRDDIHLLAMTDAGQPSYHKGKGADVFESHLEEVTSLKWLGAYARFAMDDGE